MDDQELVEAALFEQHRWECSCEGMYREGLSSKPVDEACFADMLKTFGIARNLSENGNEALRQQLPKIAELHLQNPKDWKKIFDSTVPKAKANAAAHFSIEGSKTKGDASRAFVSGLTKVLWFAGTHDMPMFDSLTCRAVRAKGKTQADKAVHFYEVLEKDWMYRELFVVLQKLASTATAGWCFFPERFIDKLLLIKGLPEGDFEKRFLMGSAARRESYLNSLPASARDELKGLVVPLCNAYNLSHFSTKLKL